MRWGTWTIRVETVQLMLNISFQSEFRQNCLKAHNFYRSQHGVPPLVLNDELSAFAQEWANVSVQTLCGNFCEQPRALGFRYDACNGLFNATLHA